MGKIERLHVLDEHAEARTDGDIAIGTITCVDALRGVYVDYPGNPAGTPLAALCAAALDAAAVGRQAALLFQQADPLRPIVLGLIRRSVEPAGALAGSLAFQSAHDLSLRCGAASLSLSRDGRIVLRGSTIASYATGTQRLRGATVEIN
ncbi:DUF6484 domain-containing protein [Burkholderia sp. FERM BP-3421]|jgi:Domain of unknown function (DUF6484)|uniref:DUF6484 domain-containing protein n=1 Tax=Burkholderia sp. FERM BP-3421 TaxID=1494466 RepID=UPI00235F8BFA|nr:DUF6484 domain-containing protein [Burkholderia sp. FERM BP-3421]WDD92048.1 DUF6484 domain-containing protein [Burkholderia sp. FERM BP-3421]